MLYVCVYVCLHACMYVCVYMCQQMDVDECTACALNPDPYPTGVSARRRTGQRMLGCDEVDCMFNVSSLGALLESTLLRAPAPSLVCPDSWSFGFYLPPCRRQGALQEGDVLFAVRAFWQGTHAH